MNLHPFKLNNHSLNLFQWRQDQRYLGFLIFLLFWVHGTIMSAFAVVPQSENGYMDVGVAAVDMTIWLYHSRSRVRRCFTTVRS